MHSNILRKCAQEVYGLKLADLCSRAVCGVIQILFLVTLTSVLSNRCFPVNTLCFFQIFFFFCCHCVPQSKTTIKQPEVPQCERFISSQQKKKKEKRCVRVYVLCVRKCVHVCVRVFLHCVN